MTQNRCIHRQTICKECLINVCKNCVIKNVNGKPLLYCKDFNCSNYLPLHLNKINQSAQQQQDNYLIKKEHVNYLLVTLYIGFFWLFIKMNNSVVFY